ncbi:MULTISPECIES: hypothetical protein [unclassified Sphingomonas]|uniref:hypothetical protein n=1 Tax=unclassified Sphingomonas TaxID=196159 RepID=UPI00226A0019|nr:MULTISPECIES: hypothetical protein [unclassified Sphingomonas]
MMMFGSALAQRQRFQSPGPLADDQFQSPFAGATPMPSSGGAFSAQQQGFLPTPNASAGMASPSRLSPSPSFADLGASPAIPFAQMQVPTPDMSKLEKPSFFSSGGLGLKLLGSVSDGILGANGMAPVYGPAVAARQQQNALTQRQALQQSAETQRQLMVEAFRRAHPEPTEFEKVLMAGGYAPGTPAYVALARQKAQADAMGTPMVYDQYNAATGATDKVIAPRTSFMGPSPTATPAGPPDAAVAHLRSNPSLAGAFDQKYGLGASAHYLGNGAGGAAPTASTPFPIR